MSQVNTPQVPTSTSQLASPAPVNVAETKAVSSESSVTTPDTPAGPTPARDDALLTMARQMLSDSIVTASYHVLNVVLNDAKLREDVIRYQHKVSKAHEPAAVFHQSCRNRVWEPIEKLSVNSKRARMMFTDLARVSQKLVDDNNTDVMVFCVDYVHPAAMLMSVRYSCLLTLLKDPKVDKERPKNVKVADHVKLLTANSVLVEEDVKIQVTSMLDANWDMQMKLDDMLASVLKERRTVSLGYAHSLFMQDIREACIMTKMHENVLKEDAAANDDTLAPTRCFRIRTGIHGVPAKVSEYVEKDLVAMTDESKTHLKVDPLFPTYKQALEMVRGPREKNHAVCIVSRMFDGPLTTEASANIHMVNMAVVGYKIDEERARRAAVLEQHKQNFIKLSASLEE